MKNLSLDDLLVFIVIAECGTISEAARKLDSSPATLGRRMAQLEDAIGLRLFHRHRSGYELTRDGRCVLKELQPMTRGWQAFERWLGGRACKPRVRLCGDAWTMRFLAQRFAELSRSEDPFDVMFLASEARMNIEQREIDIDVRAAPPTAANLASRRLAAVAHAAFVHRDRAGERGLPWIGIEPDHVVPRTGVWVLERHAADIAAYAASPQTLLDLAVAGVGIAVLPCFVGDAVPALCRLGPVIDELTEVQHIVFHNEARYHPHIRAVGDRIIHVVMQNADLYEGRRCASA
ncbi:LysR family transcriptional regulator [Salinarimonas sp. NSM]|uniref:LysR family transcriptional regulator n=1 Tax=Salinarimonas sp. NSM TaxID=3458003 RepID=UPI0040350AC8